MPCHSQHKSAIRRANFRVQQLPLFNRLKPEGEIGASLSNFQDERRLNTKRTRKFMLRSQSGITIYFLFSILFFFLDCSSYQNKSLGCQVKVRHTQERDRPKKAQMKERQSKANLLGIQIYIDSE